MPQWHTEGNPWVFLASIRIGFPSARYLAHTYILLEGEHDPFVFDTLALLSQEEKSYPYPHDETILRKAAPLLALTSPGDKVRIVLRSTRNPHAELAETLVGFENLTLAERLKPR